MARVQRVIHLGWSLNRFRFSNDLEYSVDSLPNLCGIDTCGICRVVHVKRYRMLVFKRPTS